MSNNIEDEIVSMQFDNKSFESGVATSLSTLDKLKSSLKFTGAGQGLNDVNTAVGRFNLNPMSAAIQGVSKTWLGLSTVAITAIGTITNKAVNAGLELGKSLTVNPIAAGFKNYEEQINATKTILSNTASSGATLKDVTGTLKELNDYANLTVYNFSDMAKNIGTFTAAGVALKPAAESIKGIANLAALSGSTSEQASGAMYQLSQAIAAGQVHLQDWNSVVNAGIGGTVFQRALAQTAVAMGTLDKSQVKLSGSMKNVSINGAAFRNSLTPPPGGTSWLTSGVLTKTLATFTGDLSKGQLVAEGFTKSQAKAILAQGKMAVAAATQVKTFSQLTQALKEEVAAAWANVFKAIFGNIKQSTKFFSAIHNVLQNALTGPINNFATLLEQFRKFGGFTALWQSFVNIFKTFGNLIKPIKDAFGVIFPSSGTSAKGMASLAKTFEHVTAGMEKLSEGAVKIEPFFVRFFSIIKIGIDTVSAFASQLKLLAPVFKTIGSAIGDFFQQGYDIANNLLAGILQGLDPAELQRAVVQLAQNIIKWIKDELGIHSPASTMVPVGMNIIQGIVQGLLGAANLIIGALQKVFSGVGQALKFIVQNVHWGDVVNVINEALLVGIVLAFRNFLNAFTGTVTGFQEIIHHVNGILGQLTSSLKTMQSKVRSEIIRNIAISVALLAASAALLATVDGKKLAISLGAIAGMMTALLGVMYAIGGGGKGKHIDNKAVARQTTQIFAMSAALIAFATAVLILTTAVALMGQLKPQTIEKGLAGVAGVIALITAATAILGKTGGGATMIATSTALVILAAGLTAFVGVMKLYSELDWKTLIRGGGTAAAVIFGLGLAMRGFGKGAIGGSVGLVIASAALVILAKAMQQFASIGLGNMIKSVVALDFILGSIAGAALLMSGAEGGAGSMLVFSAAIIVLAKALGIIAAIPILGLVKAIGTLVVALGLIAGASIVLAPAVPLISALGVAVLLLGGAVLATGVGVLAFATAMGILAVVGPAAFAAVSQGIDDLLKKLPELGQAMGGFIVNMATGFVKAAGPLVKAIGKLLGIIIDELIKLIPKLKKLAIKLIAAILDVIGSSAGHAAKVMFRLIMAILNVMENNVPKMVKKGAELIVAVIQGLGSQATKIANATGRTILQFLRGLDRAINKYEKPIIHEGFKIAGDLVSGLVSGLKDELNWGKIQGAVESMASHIPGWAKKVLGIGSPSKVMASEVGRWIPHGVAQGIDDHSSLVDDSAKDLAKRSLEAMRYAFRTSKSGVEGLANIKPTITPVLDLSQIERDSVKMGSIIGGTHKISTDLSRSKAGNIATRHANRGRLDAESGGNTYNFHQTINSPKAISPVKVYRGTKSQIALFKEVTHR